MRTTLETRWLETRAQMILPTIHDPLEHLKNCEHATAARDRNPNRERQRPGPKAGTHYGPRTFREGRRP